MQFQFNDWLVYFYFYCMFGWVFESTYVSLRTRKWTNRGFMKGPWLPLYGTGAIIILLVTLPLSEYPVAVYFAGLVAATVLEYVTGVVMVKLFKVRYWDYSTQKFQFQGHICLTSSLAWGGLSLLMVYVIHPPVAKFIAMWNENVLNILTFVVTLCTAYDFANAFREAMDLRALLMQAEEVKRRMEETLAEKKEELAKAMEESKEQLEESKERIAETIGETLEGRREQIAVKQQRKEEQSAARREKLEATLSELERMSEGLKRRMELHSARLLLQNPGSSYFGMKEVSGEIRKRILERRKEK